LVKESEVIGVVGWIVSLEKLARMITSSQVGPRQGNFVLQIRTVF